MKKLSHSVPDKDTREVITLYAFNKGIGQVITLCAIQNDIGEVCDFYYLYKDTGIGKVDILPGPWIKAS